MSIIFEINASKFAKFVIIVKNRNEKNFKHFRIDECRRRWYFKKGDYRREQKFIIIDKEKIGGGNKKREVSFEREKGLKSSLERCKRK
jgi:hypothetical protein